MSDTVEGGDLKEEYSPEPTVEVDPNAVHNTLQTLRETGAITETVYNTLATLETERDYAKEAAEMARFYAAMGDTTEIKPDDIGQTELSGLEEAEDKANIALNKAIDGFESSGNLTSGDAKSIRSAMQAEKGAAKTLFSPGGGVSGQQAQGITGPFSRAHAGLTDPNPEPTRTLVAEVKPPETTFKV